MIHIAIFSFVGLMAFLLLIFIFWAQKKDIEQKLESNKTEFNKDFLSKMEFFFNTLNEGKKETEKRTFNSISPITKTLEKLQLHIDDIEKNRVNRDNNVNNYVNKLVTLQEDIKKETQKIVKTFQNTHTRGKWGEVQLERIAEMSGMLPFCEFSTQCRDFDGIRPDMIVKIPNGGHIFIDAKTPMEAYNKFIDKSESDHENAKKENSKAIRTHIYNLSKKKYWENAPSPDFTVMFIPLESIWMAALEVDHNIMEYAVEKNIIVATPMTLIGLLKTVFIGWKHVKFAKDAEKLKKSLAIVDEYLISLNKHIVNINKKNEEISEILINANQITSKLQKETSLYNNLAEDVKLIDSEDLNKLDLVDLDNNSDFNSVTNKVNIFKNYNIDNNIKDINLKDSNIFKNGNLSLVTESNVFKNNNTDLEEINFNIFNKEIEETTIKSEKNLYNEILNNLNNKINKNSNSILNNNSSTSNGLTTDLPIGLTEDEEEKESLKKLQNKIASLLKINEI